MHISELTSTAVVALAKAEHSGKAVVCVTAEATRDGTGWISFADVVRVNYHDGTTLSVNIGGTPLADALERHADDEAELGGVPDAVVIPIPLR